MPQYLVGLVSNGFLPEAKDKVVTDSRSDCSLSTGTPEEEEPVTSFTVAVSAR